MPESSAKAFSGTAVAADCLAWSSSFGVARGVFSNEAGLGSAPIAHAASKTKDPVMQGTIACLGTFIDTMVVCSSPAWSSWSPALLQFNGTGRMSIAGNLSGAALSQAAFNQTMPGLGGFVVGFGLIFFAFSTILGWYYYGSKCCEYIAGLKAVGVYKWVYAALVFVGATVPLNFVWNLSDAFNGLMAIPNLVALVTLSPVIFALLRKYEQKEGVRLAAEETE